MKKINAVNHRPCTNWPNPGHKKLHNAEITFPAEPCPSLMDATIQPPQLPFKPIQSIAMLPWI